MFKIAVFFIYDFFQHSKNWTVLKIEMKNNCYWKGCQRNYFEPYTPDWVWPDQFTIPLLMNYPAQVFYLPEILGKWLLFQKHPFLEIYNMNIINTLNRLSRRKRGMASNPLFIICTRLFLHFSNELCCGYLRFEGCLSLVLLNWGSQQGRPFSLPSQRNFPFPSNLR